VLLGLKREVILIKAWIPSSAGVMVIVLNHREIVSIALGISIMAVKLQLGSANWIPRMDWLD
jgi:uncharacterized membrane protein